jgi:ribulose kinase
MLTQEVLETVARGMVAAGLYKDIAAAIRAMALEQIERKIATYRAQVEEFEKKYQHSLEAHTGVLTGRASMAEEEEWMEWKGAAVMLEAWRKALQEVLKHVGASGH